MRTILPVSFSIDMYFFIVVEDFERAFDNCLDEIFGYFLISFKIASNRVWPVVWSLVWVPLYECLLKQTVTNPFPFVYVGSSTRCLGM